MININQLEKENQPELLQTVEVATPTSLPSLTTTQTYQHRKPWWQSLGRKPTALLGLSILLVVLFFAIFSPFLTNYEPSRGRLSEARLPPFSPGHLLGTDFSGRDVWANLIYGARVPVLVGGFTVLLSGLVGVTLGLLAGYYRGWLDDVINWLSNVILSFPFILLVISVVAVLGQNLINLIIVISLTSWVIYARVVRGETFAIREKEFVEAARAIGMRNRQILFKHILPNVVTTLIVLATLQIAQVIMVEAALSYLGLGVERTTASWGKFLSENKDKLPIAPWLVLVPGLAISLTVLAVNFVGDWLREELDPKLNL
jgi:peptide/nickel transport system permease protein